MSLEANTAPLPKTPYAIHTRLREMGLTVGTDGTSILLSPKRLITPEAVALVKQDRDALLAHLIRWEAAEKACDAMASFSEGEWPPPDITIQHHPDGTATAFYSHQLEALMAWAEPRKAMRASERAAKAEKARQQDKILKASQKASQEPPGASLFDAG